MPDIFAADYYGYVFFADVAVATLLMPLYSLCYASIIFTPLAAFAAC